MDLLKRKLSFSGKKKEKKPNQWQDDEKAVRTGTRAFHVKYLGCIEVQDSRSVNICEQAIQSLLNEKSQHMKASLLVSADALRVVDENKKGLIVDQTIEKVSFCAPDRFHEKGFAYICRDGATRRWLCHGFLTTKETGERLSYAVGCAFQICLERKQKRDRDCQLNGNRTSLTRFGSFRSVSLTERIIDPQSALIAEPVPLTPSIQKNSFIERPRPKGSYAENLKRHTSFHQLFSTKTISEEENKFYQTNAAFHSTSIISENLTASLYSLNSPSIHSNQTSPDSINETFNPFAVHSSFKRSTNPFDDFSH